MMGRVMRKLSPCGDWGNVTSHCSCGRSSAVFAWIGPVHGFAPLFSPHCFPQIQMQYIVSFRSLCGEEAFPLFRYRTSSDECSIEKEKIVDNEQVLRSGVCPIDQVLLLKSGKPRRQSRLRTA